MEKFYTGAQIKMNKKLIDAYIELTKPSINALILVTTALGFYLADGFHHPWHMIITLLGAAFTCAGSGVLNHYLERDVDALMERTKHRRKNI